MFISDHEFNQVHVSEQISLKRNIYSRSRNLTSGTTRLSPIGRGWNHMVAEKSIAPGILANSEHLGVKVIAFEGKLKATE